MKKGLILFGLAVGLMLTSCGTEPEEGDVRYDEPGEEGIMSQEHGLEEGDTLDSAERSEDEGLEEEDQRQEDLEEARERDQEGYDPDPTGEKQTSPVGRPAIKNLGEDES